MGSADSKGGTGVLSRLKGVFVGPGSLTDFGERFLILNRHRETSNKGMYAIGDVAGTPDIKAALNAGYELGRHIADLPRRTRDKVDYDVVIVGAGPAGVNCASELAKAGKSALVLDRKSTFQTIRAFAKSKALFVASTGDAELLGDFAFEDCRAEELINDWDDVLAKKDLEIHNYEDVKEIKQRGAFEVWTRDKEGEQLTYLADRIVVAVGKPRLLARLELEAASDKRIRYQTRYEGGVEGSKVLVVAHAGSYEGFEMALEMAPNNEVTVIYEDPGSPDLQEAFLKRFNAAVESGRIEYFQSTRLSAIEDKTVTLQLPDGSSRSIDNDVIYSGKIIDRELPANDLSRFGLNVERRMSTMSWVVLGSLFLFFAFVYMGKSGKADVIWPGFSKVRAWIEANVGLGRLQMYQLWSLVYSIGIVGFGAKAIWKYQTKFRDAEQGYHQTKKLLSLMVFQVVFLFILPEFVLHNWRAYGIVLAWPLNLNPDSYAGFVSSWNAGHELKPLVWINGIGLNENHLYFAWTVFLTLALLPILVWRRGMSYCTWICSCGGLAETVGDDWRQFSPKGPANTKRERFIYVVLGATALIMMTSMMNVHGLVPVGLSATVDGVVKSWSWVVDLFMCGIIPLVLYPFMSGRTWCRYACPTAGFMKLLSRKTTNFGIQPDKARCIACGMCDRYCEVGVPIRKHALKGKFFSANDTTCISCGICISVCPTDVLKFDVHPDKRPLPMAV